MKYLLDTNHWAHIQRRHPTVLQHMKALSARTKYLMPVIAQGELLAGIEALPEGKRKAGLRAAYEATMRQVAELVLVDTDFGMLTGALRRTGKPIGTNDLWIAATAIAHNLTLVTSDANFRAVPGLRLEDWATESVPPPQ
jgi:tRNA(fMet)-specific endonuclease VapC